MFYNILAIFIGLLLIGLAVGYLKSKQGKWMIFVSLFCASGLISSGVTGFLLSDSLSYIVILMMIFFVGVYLLSYLIFTKRLKNKEKKEKFEQE